MQFGKCCHLKSCVSALGLQQHSESAFFWDTLYISLISKVQYFQMAVLSHSPVLSQSFHTLLCEMMKWSMIVAVCQLRDIFPHPLSFQSVKPGQQLAKRPLQEGNETQRHCYYARAVCFTRKTLEWELCHRFPVNLLKVFPEPIESISSTKTTAAWVATIG